MERHSRRDFLRLSVGTGVAGLAGCQAPAGPDQEETETSRPTPSTVEGMPTTVETGDPLQVDIPLQGKTNAPVDVRGALYLPARAWNTYQMWEGYNREVIERDLGYAARVNLNAIRTWLNFEYWKENPQACDRQLEHLLSAAEENGLHVLLTLFEGVGVEPTREALTDEDPFTATLVRSPSTEIARNQSRWDEPREYVNWVLDGWGDDERLLGLEVMNEPGWSSMRKRFAGGMFQTLRRNRGSAPLTVGSTSLTRNLDYVEWGSDILQFHYNFPTSDAAFRDLLRQVRIVRERIERPIWLTEWQRLRSGVGFHSAPSADEMDPDYSSMAPTIQEFGFGNFFWSLMVKPAAALSQRKLGVLNGLFHEDGAVWSRDDARAIKAMSGDATFEGRERQEWPDWAADLERRRPN